MSRTILEGTESYDLKMANRTKYGVNVQAVTAQVGLLADSATVQVLTPNADLDVLLPDETLPANRGLVFIIFNNAAAASGFDLLVKENDDTTLVDTLTEQQGAMFVCVGTKWIAIRGATA